MKRYILILIMILLGGCSSLMPLQRSRLITAFHLIEDKKYDEAKAFIEGMAEEENSAQWPRTWHARGLLYQNAYREGIEKNNKKLYELIPGQLFEAYESYEKALELDAGNGIRSKLVPKYVLLANDFQSIGQKKFREGKYDEALQAFQTVEKIRHSELLKLDTDTSLVYNIALAAIEGKNHQTAINYLTRLNEYSYGTNVSHLLSAEYLHLGDSLNAQHVLEEGITKYEDNEELILLLVDLHFSRNNAEESFAILDHKSALKPSSYKIPYTKGLILQKTGQYKEAIAAYEKSLTLEPEKTIIYAQIAACFYNIGIEIEESARTMNNNSLVEKERKRSTAALESAITWLNKALELETNDGEALAIIHDLSTLLDITERVEGLNGAPAENEASDTK
jgi:tetratricopeptide (TPR) repeat protein